MAQADHVLGVVAPVFVAHVDLGMRLVDAYFALCERNFDFRRGYFFNLLNLRHCVVGDAGNLCHFVRGANDRFFRYLNNRCFITTGCTLILFRLSGKNRFKL